MGLDMYMSAVRRQDAQKIIVQDDYDDPKGHHYIIDPEGNRVHIFAHYVKDSDQGDYHYEWRIDEENHPRNNELVTEVYGKEVKHYILDEDFYWRKFNALHAWMVSNYTDSGVDDCKPHDLSVEKFVELYNLLKKVIAIFPPEEEWTEQTDINFITKERYTYKTPVLTPEQEEEIGSLLHTRSGFFFGDTEYDEWYYHHVKRSIEYFDKVMPEVESGEITKFIYTASW